MTLFSSPWHHALFLLEGGEHLSLFPVVPQKLVELLGDNGRPVLPAQLDAGGLQEVGLAKAQRRFLEELQDEVDLKEDDV